ncbi:MAG: 2-amino-4-hydroxy-6-hydroxymethyldihydropteridine diphosphokinase [Spirochaetaceae bacterium]|jgi:2-amino-4-hydroxy-6-hydroxymethyldihydropteridine diphosphokinase|nr:2-amino-4-hydroxy-6-hydroxymethyldihydropteridine diphosphokinase [Spirochaetaceae bacterium]
MAFSSPKEAAGIPVVLGLGSNQGDSRGILGDALEALGELLEETRAASVFETEPLLVTDQGRFLNTALGGRYRGEPRELLEHIHRIEARFGRDRKQERRWGERPLDIDILLFGGLVLSEPPELEIPHPRLTERRFALVPLLELFPDAADPRTGKAYRAFMEELPRQGIYYAGPGGYTDGKWTSKTQARPEVLE